MQTLEDRITELEVLYAELEKVVEELNLESIRQNRIIERLVKENKSLKESIGGNVKPLSEETPPPHY